MALPYEPELGGRHVRQPIAFLGAGGAATGLAMACHAAGLTVAAVWSRRRERAEALASFLSHARVTTTPQEAVDAGQLVVLAVPDHVIASLCAQLRWNPEHGVIHLAGAYGPELLAPAAVAGAATGAFHPLQTFAGDPDPRAWQGITVVIEAEPPFAEELVTLAKLLGANPQTLLPTLRPLYHAAAALAANGLVALVGVAAPLLAQALGSDRSAAVRALLPLLQGVLRNLASLGLPWALTGPVARADRETLARHRAALEEVAPHLIPLYCELAQAMLPLAQERAADDPERYAQLSGLAVWLSEWLCRETRNPSVGA